MRFAGWTGAVAICLLRAPVAGAQSPAESEGTIKTECLHAHEHAQEARRASKFGEARRLLRACAAEACPALVRADCVPWLTDLERVYPTVVFDAYVDGRQMESARVMIDGALATERIDGKPIEVDPGEHTFRFEVPGFPPREQRLVIFEGPDHRLVSASFEHAKPVDKPVRTRPVSTSVWVATGVAAASVVSLAVFGSLALAQKQSLEGSCAPVCTNSQMNGLLLDVHAADASLALAAAAAITGGILFLVRPAAERRTSALSVGIAPGSGGGTLSLRLSL